MPGLVAGIHAFILADAVKTWMPGTRRGMTASLTQEPLRANCRKIEAIAARGPKPLRNAWLHEACPIPPNRKRNRHMRNISKVSYAIALIAAVVATASAA